MKQLIKKIKAFTLTELIVVIVIIGILVAVLIPTVTGYIRKSQIAADTAAAKNMNNVIQYHLIEEDIDNMEDLKKTLAAGGFDNNIVPQSAKHGYNFWYDVENKKIVFEKSNKLFAETATLEKLASSNTSSDFLYYPETFKTTNGTYVLLDSKGSELIDALNNFYAVNSEEEYNLLNERVTKFSENYKQIGTYLLEKFNSSKFAYDENGTIVTSQSSEQLTSTSGYLFIGNSVKVLPSNFSDLFLGSGEFNNVFVPETVEEIQNNAFANINSKYLILMHENTLPILNESSLNFVTKEAIFVKSLTVSMLETNLQKFTSLPLLIENEYYEIVEVEGKNILNKISIQEATEVINAQYNENLTTNLVNTFAKQYGEGLEEPIIIEGRLEQSQFASNGVDLYRDRLNKAETTYDEYIQKLTETDGVTMFEEKFALNEMCQLYVRNLTVRDEEIARCIDELGRHGNPESVIGKITKFQNPNNLLYTNEREIYSLNNIHPNTINYLDYGSGLDITSGSIADSIQEILVNYQAKLNMYETEYLTIVEEFANLPIETIFEDVQFDQAETIKELCKEDSDFTHWIIDKHSDVYTKYQVNMTEYVTLEEFANLPIAFNEANISFEAGKEYIDFQQSVQEAFSTHDSSRDYLEIFGKIYNIGEGVAINNELVFLLDVQEENIELLLTSKNGNSEYEKTFTLNSTSFTLVKITNVIVAGINIKDKENISAIGNSDDLIIEYSILPVNVTDSIYISINGTEYRDLQSTPTNEAGKYTITIPKAVLGTYAKDARTINKSNVTNYNDTNGDRCVIEFHSNNNSNIIAKYSILIVKAQNITKFIGNDDNSFVKVENPEDPALVISSTISKSKISLVLLNNIVVEKIKITNTYCISLTESLIYGNNFKIEIKDGKKFSSKSNANFITLYSDSVLNNVQIFGVTEKYDTSTTIMVEQGQIGNVVNCYIRFGKFNVKLYNSILNVKNTVFQTAIQANINLVLNFKYPDFAINGTTLNMTDCSFYGNESLGIFADDNGENVGKPINVNISGTTNSYKWRETTDKTGLPSIISNALPSLVKLLSKEYINTYLDKEYINPFYAEIHSNGSLKPTSVINSDTNNGTISNEIVEFTYYFWTRTAKIASFNNADPNNPVLDDNIFNLSDRNNSTAYTYQPNMAKWADVIA